MWAEYFLNKKILISGASSGIGEALAKKAASLGATPILVARREDRLIKIAKEIVHKTKIEPYIAVADVTNQNLLKQVVKEVLLKYGSLDIVVANAGFGVFASFEELTNDDYKRQFETNLFGVINLARSCIPALKASTGRLCIVGSLGGFLAAENASAYGMSKAALHSFAHNLRCEIKKHGVSVTLCVPGGVNTEIWTKDNFGEISHKYSGPHLPNAFKADPIEVSNRILRAVLARKQEVSVTADAAVILKLQQFFPSFCRNALPTLIQKIMGASFTNSRPP